MNIHAAVTLMNSGWIMRREEWTLGLTLTRCRCGCSGYIMSNRTLPTPQDIESDDWETVARVH